MHTIKFKESIYVQRGRNIEANFNLEEKRYMPINKYGNQNATQIVSTHQSTGRNLNQ